MWPPPYSYTRLELTNPKFPNFKLLEPYFIGPKPKIEYSPKSNQTEYFQTFSITEFRTFQTLNSPPKTYQISECKV